MLGENTSLAEVCISVNLDEYVETFIEDTARVNRAAAPHLIQEWRFRVAEDLLENVVEVGCNDWAPMNGVIPFRRIALINAWKARAFLGCWVIILIHPAAGRACRFEARRG